MKPQAVAHDRGLGNWTLYADCHAAQPRRAAMVTGDAEQVFDLHLRGDQQRVNRALIERIEQGQNWRGIDRAIPHVRCELEDVGATRAS